MSVDCKVVSVECVDRQNPYRASKSNGGLVFKERQRRKVRGVCVCMCVLFFCDRPSSSVALAGIEGGHAYTQSFCFLNQGFLAVIQAGLREIHLPLCVCHHCMA